VRFVDDYWLALVPASCKPAAPPKLVLLNTDQTMMDNPTLVKTAFYFDLHEHSDEGGMRLHSDQGGYKPSPEESSLAPFYRVTSQRMLAVGLTRYNLVFVVKIDVLLRLARERGGTELQWGQWKSHAVGIQHGGYGIIWVSGPQFFYIYRIIGEGIWLEVHDFSPRAYARHVETITDQDGVARQMVRQPGVKKLCLPRMGAQFVGGGHDSIAILKVNTLPVP